MTTGNISSGASPAGARLQALSTPPGNIAPIPQNGQKVDEVAQTTFQSLQEEIKLLRERNAELERAKLDLVEAASAVVRGLPLTIELLGVKEALQNLQAILPPENSLQTTILRGTVSGSLGNFVYLENKLAALKKHFPPLKDLRTQIEIAVNAENLENPEQLKIWLMTLKNALLDVPGLIKEISWHVNIEAQRLKIECSKKDLISNDQAFKAISHYYCTLCTDWDFIVEEHYAIETLVKYATLLLSIKHPLGELSAQYTSLAKELSFNKDELSKSSLLEDSPRHKTLSACKTTKLELDVRLGTLCPVYKSLQNDSNPGVFQKELEDHSLSSPVVSRRGKILGETKANFLQLRKAVEAHWEDCAFKAKLCDTLLQEIQMEQELIRPVRALADEAILLESTLNELLCIRSETPSLNVFIFNEQARHFELLKIKSVSLQKTIPSTLSGGKAQQDHLQSLWLNAQATLFRSFLSLRRLELTCILHQVKAKVDELTSTHETGKKNITTLIEWVIKTGDIYRETTLQAAHAEVEKIKPKITVLLAEIPTFVPQFRQSLENFSSEMTLKQKFYEPMFIDYGFQNPSLIEMNLRNQCTTHNLLLTSLMESIEKELNGLLALAWELEDLLQLYNSYYTLSRTAYDHCIVGELLYTKISRFVSLEAPKMRPDAIKAMGIEIATEIVTFMQRYSTLKQEYETLKMQDPISAKMALRKTLMIEVNIYWAAPQKLKETLSHDFEFSKFMHSNLINCFAKLKSKSENIRIIQIILDSVIQKGVVHTMESKTRSPNIKRISSAPVIEVPIVTRPQPSLSFSSDAQSNP